MMNSGRWSPFSTVYWVPQPFSTPEYVDSDFFSAFLFFCAFTTQQQPALAKIAAISSKQLLGKGS